VGNSARFVKLCILYENVRSDTENGSLPSRKAAIEADIFLHVVKLGQETFSFVKTAATKDREHWPGSQMGSRLETDLRPFARGKADLHFLISSLLAFAVEKDWKQGEPASPRLPS
jgi:hypothetical protein